MTAGDGGGGGGRVFRQQSTVTGAAHALGQAALSPSGPVIDGLIAVLDAAMDQLETHIKGGPLPAEAVGEDEDGPFFNEDSFGESSPIADDH